MYIQTGIHKLHVNNKEMFDFKNVFQQKYDYFMTSFNKNQRDPAWIEWSVGVGMTISVNAYSSWNLTLMQRQYSNVRSFMFDSYLNTEEHTLFI